MKFKDTRHKTCILCLLCVPNIYLVPSRADEVNVVSNNDNTNDLVGGEVVTLELKFVSKKICCLISTK